MPSPRRTYWQPKASNLPAFDALVPQTTFFQFTVSSLADPSSHPLDFPGVSTVDAEFNQSEYDVIFVVPCSSEAIEDPSKFVEQNFKNIPTCDNFINRLTVEQLWNFYKQLNPSCANSQHPPDAVIKGLVNQFGLKVTTPSPVLKAWLRTMVDSQPFLFDNLRSQIFPDANVHRKFKQWAMVVDAQTVFSGDRRKRKEDNDHSIRKSRAAMDASPGEAAAAVAAAADPATDNSGDSEDQFKSHNDSDSTGSGNGMVNDE